MDMWYFARICVHARSWREFAKCWFAHFPSFFSSMLTPMKVVWCVVNSVIGLATARGILEATGGSYMSSEEAGKSHSCNAWAS